MISDRWFPPIKLLGAKNFLVNRKEYVTEWIELLSAESFLNRLLLPWWFVDVKLAYSQGIKFEHSEEARITNHQERGWGWVIIFLSEILYVW